MWFQGSILSLIKHTAFQRDVICSLFLERFDFSLTSALDDQFGGMLRADMGSKRKIMGMDVYVSTKRMNDVDRNPDMGCCDSPCPYLRFSTMDNSRPCPNRMPMSFRYPGPSVRSSTGRRCRRRRRSRGPVGALVLFRFTLRAVHPGYPNSA